MNADAQWTRDEILLAEKMVPQMSLTRDEILEGLLPMTRQTQAIEQGMCVDRWVPILFAMERYDDAVAAVAKSPDDPELTAAFVAAVTEVQALAGAAVTPGRPKDFHADQWTRLELASGAMRAQLHRKKLTKFMQVEVADNRRMVAARRGLSAEAWVAEIRGADAALRAMEEGLGRGDTPKTVAAASGVPLDVASRVAALLEVEANKAADPLKYRTDEARAAARQIAEDWELSDRKAWKEYDLRHAPTPRQAEVIKAVRRLQAFGLDDDRIADEAGISVEWIARILERD